MRSRVLAALAVADFRERVRRPSYAVVLLAAVGLGYLAAPAAGAHWTIVNAGAHRGVYNSAYIGMVTALAGALWLSTAGFYVIRTAIARDRQTGVGELLAATPMRAGGYLLGKFLSNLLVLGSMAAALAGTALAMQLARGESRAVHPIALLSPFVLCTLPVLAVAAAAAVVFETTPVLRGGVGNVIWLFVSLAGAIAGQSANAPLGGLGVTAFAGSLRDAFAARGIALNELGLGLMYLDEPPRAVLWTGMNFTATFAGQRLLLVLLAAAVSVVPALWFDRFDRSRTAAPTGSATAATPTDSAVAAGLLMGNVDRKSRPVLRSPDDGRLRVADAYRSGGITTRRGAGAVRLVRGEIRILTRGISRWWWLVTLALMVAGIAAPVSSRPLLMAAWIWPVLIWSRLGAQTRELGAEALLDAYPSPTSRTLAQWLAGAALTATVGLGPGLTMATDGRLAGWLAGVAFIPALALALGVISRTQRFFQAVYPLLWYMVINDVAGLDYMGVLSGGPSPLVVGAAATILLLSALMTVAARHRCR